MFFSTVSILNFYAIHKIFRPAKVFAMWYFSPYAELSADKVIHTHTHAHTHMHARAHTCTHAHTHTHMYLLVRASPFSSLESGTTKHILVATIWTHWTIAIKTPPELQQQVDTRSERKDAHTRSFSMHC